MRRSYLSLPGGDERDLQGRARGVDLEDQRGSAFLRAEARHLERGRGDDDRERLLQAGLPRAADGVRRRGAKALGRESRGQRRLSQWIPSFILTTTRRRASR